jgi:DNA-binding CsgD family transcriptional regulator
MRATLLGMRLLQRGSSLASLAGYAREARQGDGRLVLVAGEAGVGKSAQKMCRLGIRSIPAGPRSATREHPLGLTRREREVLDPICTGHTNAEIAAKLFISAKTVNHHVSAVLAKLDAPTRGVAASYAAGSGWPGRREYRELRGKSG